MSADSMRRVNVAIVGAGFIAETHARTHGIPDVDDDCAEVFSRPDVHVVDLCIPNHLHRPMTELAAAAGKHVICAKPLTAFDGHTAPQVTDFRTVPRTEMLPTGVQSADAMVAAAERAGVQIHLMYAENWVYAPSIAEADRLAAAVRSAILEMRGGECHSGSHSPYSKEWRYAGGGARCASVRTPLAPCCT